jgi:energy-coupling factor transporter ATP-binding protein EcfA2
MTAPVLEARGVRFRYPDGTKAFDGVDFQLPPGETVAVLGGNGSGKTTFLLHLNGLLCGAGFLRVCGLPVTKSNLLQIRQKVGMVFQDSDNQLFMPTALEDVAFGPLNLGQTPAAAMHAAEEALARTGMAHAAHKAPYHLSAGEKKRVAIAGVLAMRPEVLVFDEPTTFLDPPAQSSLLQLMLELPQAKLIATHDLEFAAALADRAVFFQQGRIAGEGPVSELAARFHWERRSPSFRQ